MDIAPSLKLSILMHQQVTCRLWLVEPMYLHQTHLSTTQIAKLSKKQKNIPKSLASSTTPTVRFCCSWADHAATSENMVAPYPNFVPRLRDECISSNSNSTKVIIASLASLVHNVVNSKKIRSSHVCNSLNHMEEKHCLCTFQKVVVPSSLLYHRFITQSLGKIAKLRELLCLNSYMGLTKYG